MGDRFGGFVLRPGSLRRLPARSGAPRCTAAAQDADRAVRARPCHRTDDLAASVEKLSRLQRRRGLRVVCPTFLTPGDHELDPNVRPSGNARCGDWGTQPGAGCRGRRSTRDRVPQRRGHVDPRSETDFERYVNTGDSDARARMDAASSAQRERIRISLRRAGVGHIQLRTDRDWVQDIARFVLAYRRVASMLHAPPQGVTK
jgi:uncharacterized protein (DUF58 family)